MIRRGDACGGYERLWKNIDGFGSRKGVHFVTLTDDLSRMKPMALMIVLSID